MIRFHVQADERALTVVPGRLSQIASSLQDMRKHWPAALTEARGVLLRSMESEGRSTAAGKWRPLSPSYARWKMRRFPGAKILELTGRLKASLVGASEQQVTMQPSVMTVESMVPYGGFHQSGAGFLPRRAPWSPTPKDAATIVAAISRDIRKDLFKFVGQT